MPADTAALATHGDSELDTLIDHFSRGGSEYVCRLHVALIILVVFGCMYRVNCTQSKRVQCSVLCALFQKVRGDVLRAEWARLKARATSASRDLATCTSMAALMAKRCASAEHRADFPEFIKFGNFMLVKPFSTAGSLCVNFVCYDGQCILSASLSHNSMYFV